MDRVDAIIGQWAVELPDLDTAAMATWGRIYRLAAAMGAAMEELYQQHGISRGDFDVLATLRRSGPPYRLTPTRLAAASMLTTGGMTGRLRRLEAAGLIDRRGTRETAAAAASVSPRPPGDSSSRPPGAGSPSRRGPWLGCRRTRGRAWTGRFAH